MKCERCRENIIDGDEFEYCSQILCERCYMRALSPSRACDPWAVQSAQKLSQMDDEYAELSDSQMEIIRVLEETGGLEASQLAKRIKMKLPELVTELATLRHMEKIHGQMRNGVKIVCLWDE